MGCGETTSLFWLSLPPRGLIICNVDIPVPGELFSVSPFVAQRLSNLFVLNERVALLGRWKYGFFGMVAVGTCFRTKRAHVSEALRRDKRWKHKDQFRRGLPLKRLDSPFGLTYISGPANQCCRKETSTWDVHRRNLCRSIFCPRWSTSRCW